MNLEVDFIVKSILMGIALAMDAFSVSVANGLNEPCMKKSKVFGIAGMFAFFQALMPLIGWICVRTVKQYFDSFDKLVPWIALILLGFIGGKMIYEGIKDDGVDCCSKQGLGFFALVIQGIATSIDALSAGLTIETDVLLEALVACILIAAVTFVICFGGVYLGKKAGTKLCGKAGMFGGIILIAIGVEIFISSFLK